MLSQLHTKALVVGASGFPKKHLGSTYTQWHDDLEQKMFQFAVTWNNISLEAENIEIQSKAKNVKRTSSIGLNLHDGGKEHARFG